LLGAAPPGLVYALCGGVLAGGLLQFLLPAWDLRRQGWRPSLDLSASPWLRRLLELFLPGLLGAAILQVNILVSRVLAFSVNDSAASELYLASRLMELPLGVFTLAVATVYFPQLARNFARRDEPGFVAAYLQGLRLVVAVAVPAGLGLALLGRPILTVLFEWGAFDRAAVLRTAPLIAIYGLGLPFYSVATFATRGLHAGKDMRTPVRAAGLCLIANIALSLALMGPFEAAGLAAANVGASLLQCLLLHRVLAGSRPGVRFAAVRPALFKVLAAGALMGLLCAGGNALAGLLEWPDKAAAFLSAGVLVPGCALAYFGLLWLFRFEDFERLRFLLARWLPGRRRSPVAPPPPGDRDGR
jgi:putative peptidoglycan lipid II flippase